MQAVGLIPARLDSTRLPRKLLLNETGKPLIQHVWEAARRAKLLSELIVATDSTEIAAAVRSFGGRVEMTGEHASGTDRIAEVVRRLHHEAQIVVNIQGDEPEIDPEQIDRVVRVLAENPQAEMATLATPIIDPADRENPACVKVVCAPDGRALYFSRAAIPYVAAGREPRAIGRGEQPPPPADLGRDVRQGEPARQAGGSRFSTLSSQLSASLLHIGLYGYRRDFLLRLTGLPPSRLEQLEKLEQLRALEAGATIHVEIVDHRCVGIDTPDDYARFVERQRQRAA